ncbi:hypothetical protein QYE76_015074 [Lolium multiflorum]|uniref:KIB1-4 beta-propeller domain-containing protein n=1 Tax=Lolium multiflorum TaxID=4521 RepID=A0AAD8U470_LOLMU|nr:hypothetical protein QYE76_015074 [Lolium multiflorum]
MLKCPNHELPGNIIIDNFYARLSFQDKTLLDTTCSGSFTSNKEEFKRDLLDRIKENAEDWENDKGKESGYADKPPFKPLPPKEGNEEKEEKKKKKGTKKKKKENKKKEVTAYPRVNEITLGNRKYVAPNDYCDNESEYDDLPMPFTYISDHDLNEHTTFDITNLWETNSENDNNCHSVSAIHASSHNDIESSKLGEEVFENPFATGHYVLDTSPSNNNDGKLAAVLQTSALGGPIASRCDVITAASLVGSCKFYHDSATQSVALPASQPFGMPCVLHTHQTEVPPAHNPFSRVHKFKQQGAQKDKQHDAKDRKGTLCQLTPLDRISSDAVIPDGGTGMWAGANGDWIALLGFPWNWELVNVYTGRRIPLPPISEFKSTPDKLVFESNDQHLQLLKIAICRVPTAASNYTSFSVLAIFNAAIAVLHCASSRWTVLDNQFLAYGYSDAIIHKGIVFAVTQTGEVYAWNQLSWGPLLISTAPIPPELDEQGRYNLGSWWLARSPDGSRLFLVHTWGVTDGRDYTGLVRILPAAATSEGRHGRTIRGYGKGLLGCEVYSMDTSQLMPPRPWRRIISLGSYSLFLGVNYPIIIPVEDGAEHDRPNMARSNSVYTSHHAVGLAYPPSPEICRFSLNSEDCTVGFQTNIRWTWRQVPLWLIPSFANARQWNLPSRHRLCRGGGDGHLEALTGDNIDLIAAHLDVTYTVRLAACSRELYDMISKDEGKMHHWDEPCLLMPPPAYWFDEHWDVARASRLHDTVYDLVPLDHPRRSVALPFMHDRKWLGANGDWIAAADHHEWCLVNVYTERHIPLPSLPDSKIRHSIVSYRPAYSFNWRPEIYLLKIVICQVPTKGGRYADYKLIALFDKTIFYLEGGGDWRMLEALTPAPDYPNYCDAIELRGHVFAVDETDGSTYFWDTANENLMLPFVIPPPVVDDQQYAWFLAPSADGKRLMIILTVNKIGIANAEVPPDIPYAANGLQLRQYPPVATYVFELDPLSTARAGDFLWRQVNSLSDHSLFLGLNYPIIANLKKRESKAPDGTLVPFMRKNCVYTAYRNIRYNQYPKILRCNLQPDEGETVGVISLPKDGWDSVRQAAMWFKPALNIARSVLPLKKQ